MYLVLEKAILNSIYNTLLWLQENVSYIWPKLGMIMETAFCIKFVASLVQLDFSRRLSNMKCQKHTHIPLITLRWGGIAGIAEND
jgi:hypothetical protein